MKRNKVFPAALAAAGLLLSVCMHAEAKQKDYTAANFFFDTVISLRITADENGQELLNHCMDMCRNYEHIFSRTDESSELYAVTRRKRLTSRLRRFPTCGISRVPTRRSPMRRISRRRQPR